MTEMQQMFPTWYRIFAVVLAATYVVAMIVIIHHNQGMRDAVWFDWLSALFGSLFVIAPLAVAWREGVVIPFTEAAYAAAIKRQRESA